MTQPGTNLSVTVVGVAALIVVGGALWFGWGMTADPVVSGTPPTNSALSTEPDVMMTIHVAGSVVQPGVVRVPSDSRVADVILAAGGATSDANLGALNLAATVRDGAHVVVPSHSGNTNESGATATPFDINTASVSDLEQLPGVGPVLASRIAAYRDTHGPFGAIEDLLGVPGIGEAKLSAIRDAIE